MGFVHPGIAWATLGLAAIPLILHVLNRRRHREQPWAAMAFLLEAHRRSRRRMRLEQWLLLAARTLVIVLLGLAIARPHADSSPLLPAVGRPRFDRVIVIDDSLSMSAVRKDGSTAFETARRLARTLVNSLDPSDRVAVVTAASEAHARTQLVHDRAAVRNVLNALTGTSKSVDLHGALRVASGLLEQSDALEGCRLVYILTDLSVASLPGRGIDALAAAADSRPDLRSDQGASLDAVYFVNVGPRKRPNLAIRDLRCTSPFIGAGVPALCSVEVANHGDTAVAAARVALRVDGVEVRVLDLPPLRPGQTHAAEFQVEFDRDGSHRLSAIVTTSAGDVLSADDERHLAVRVNDRIPVLAVEGRPFAEPGETELFYFRAALDARRRGGQAFRNRTTTTTPIDMDQQILDDYAVVVLGNVRRVSQTTWARLGRFVRNGGGLMMFLGDQVLPAGYNADAARTGLLPVRLTERIEPPEDTTVPSLEIADPNHPALTEFAGHDHGGLLTAHVRGYWRAEAEASDPATQTLLRFSTGDPAVMTYAVGRGHVVLWMTGPNMTWTNLPSKPDYVPLILSLTAYAAGDASTHANVLAGAALIEPVPAGRADPGGEVVRPDGNTTPVTLEPFGDAMAFIYRDTQAPGVYDLDIGGHRAHFAVNVHESDGVLTAVDPATLNDAFGTGASVVAPDQVVRVRSLLAPRREFSVMLMFALGVMAVVEGAMATWFGHQR
ncbi:MAG: BatA domain-containing protein [Phycisphaerae bacterium]